MSEKVFKSPKELVEIVKCAKCVLDESGNEVKLTLKNDEVGQVLHENSRFLFILIKSQFGSAHRIENLDPQCRDDNDFPVTFSAEGKLYNVPSALLLDKSSIFRDRLAPHQPHWNQKYILDNVSGNALQNIVQWMTTGHINHIQPKRLDHNLQAAAKLGIYDFLEDCLEQEEYYENCNLMSTYELSIKYKVTHARDKAVRKLDDNFIALIQNPYFLQYSIEQLTFLLSRDSILIDSEDDVLHAAIRWLTKDWEKRKKFLHRVLDCVKMPLVPIQSLVKMALCEDLKPIMTDSETQKRVFDSLLYQAAIDSGLGRLVLHLAPKLRRRNPPHVTPAKVHETATKCGRRYVIFKN